VPRARKENKTAPRATISGVAEARIMLPTVRGIAINNRRTQAARYYGGVEGGECRVATRRHNVIEALPDKHTNSHAQIRREQYRFTAPRTRYAQPRYAHSWRRAMKRDRQRMHKRTASRCVIAHTRGTAQGAPLTNQAQFRVTIRCRSVPLCRSSV